MYVEELCSTHYDFSMCEPVREPFDGSSGTQHLLELKTAEKAIQDGNEGCHISLRASRLHGKVTPSDAMVLVDIPRKERSEYSDALWNMTYGFDQAHETFTSPRVENKDFFNYWVGVAPFFQNVAPEGVELYARK